jgi:hypothetical protein
MNRLSTRFKTIFDATRPSKGAQRKSRTTFLDLPAELREKIYLLCFECNPTMHFGRNKGKEGRGLRKKMGLRSSRQSHGLILVNKQISGEYAYAAQKLASCVFHVSTQKDAQGIICGSAYWYTTTRLKAFMRTCRLMIDLAQCPWIHHDPVIQDIDRDFKAFIWECELLEDVRLTIDISSFSQKLRVGEAEKLSLLIRSAFVPACLNHRPLKDLTVYELPTAIDKHERCGDWGWNVERWNCGHFYEDGTNECMSSCRKKILHLWYCEDFHLLKGLPCNSSCERAQENAIIAGSPGIV